MKKIFLPLSVICFFSCSQQNITPNSPTGVPEISFDLAGMHYAHTGEQTIANGGIGVFAIKIPGIPGSTITPHNLYNISAVGGYSNVIQLLIETPNDTLKTITYHQLQNAGHITVNTTESYRFMATGDYLDVTITGYSNGVVNGNFSGKLSKIVSLAPLITQQAIVTNGKIINVKMNY